MKKALISVYDKTDVVNLAKFLIESNFEIVSSSGTSDLLKEKHIPVKKIEELTKFPEILGGRVKTLHPFIFAGILADRNNENHIKQLKQFHFGTIDLVVVNLYPFAETIKREDCTVESAIEQIDIGGVSLIRAAAKNFKHVSVLISPNQYSDFIEVFKKNEINYEYNLKLAYESFRYVTDYDRIITKYFYKMGKSGEILDIFIPSGEDLRYGENPHQKASIYFEEPLSFKNIFEVIHGRQLSYNNILDIDAAYNLINEFEETTCAIIKHTNPCGVCSDENITEAYKRAFNSDTESAFGGIIILNRQVDLKTAEEIDKIFSEIILAPSFTEDALQLLMKKKNRRVIIYKGISSNNQKDIRSITGGYLVQDKDLSIVKNDDMKVVTQKKPSETETADLIFAMKVMKHTKSNAIVCVKNKQTIGIGGGQPSRIESSRIAFEKAKKFNFNTEGCSVASDAFYPFTDGVIEAAKGGAKSIIQPGGSVRDEEVIKAADENGVCMIFTGIRHFRH